MPEIREALRRHPLMVGAALVIISAGALTLGYWSSTPRAVAQPVPVRFFVDESTGEKVTLQTRQEAPVTDGGRTLVEGHYYTCPTCGTEPQLIYLSKYTDQGKALMEKYAGDPSAMPVEDGDGLPDNTLIRRPEPGSPWLVSTSREAKRLHLAFVCPKGHRLEQAQPKDRGN